MLTRDLAARLVAAPRRCPRPGRASARPALAAGHLALVTISDSGWAAFRRMLEYKAARCGRRVHVVDRFYPSTKTCSACGHLLASISLGTRHWVCPSCGTLHDRDINAARNLIAAGLAANACGGAVRPVGATPRLAPVKQEPSPARVGAT